MARPNAEQWSAALHRLREAHETGQCTTALIRLVADGLGVAERAMWRRLAAQPPVDPARFRLSQTDRAAYVDFRGNVAAVYRARQAALAGRMSVAGVPIPEEFVQAGRVPRRAAYVVPGVRGRGDPGRGGRCARR